MTAQPPQSLLVACCFLALLCPLTELVGFGTQLKAVSGAGSPLPQTSDQVELKVTVIDAAGRVIEGLGRDNFTVMVENSAQVLSRFSAEEEPASVVLLFDLTGSMSLPQQIKTSRISIVAEPILRLLQVSHPANEYSVIRFGDTTSVALNWTRDRAEVLKAAATVEAEKPHGSTGLRSACRFAVEHAKTGTHAKRAVIFFSDGQDSPGSHSVTPAELKQVLRSEGTLFYGVNLGSIPFSLDDARRNQLDGRAQDTFRSICLMTGGSDFYPRERADLGGILEWIATALRYQYTLGFSPTPPLASGKFYKFKVKLVSQPNTPFKLKELSVLHRDGIQAR